MDTGKRIKELREKNGLTQEELGAKLGLKKAAINKYETGRVVNLKRSTIESLCEIFHVLPQELLGIEDPYSNSIPKGFDISDMSSPAIQIIEKMSFLDDDNLHKIKDYTDFLLNYRKNKWSNAV